MNPFVIFTDSGSDISADLLAQWGVKSVDLTFHTESDSKTYVTSDIPAPQFYQNMRDGKIYKTSAANLEDFRAAFEPNLQAGEDILYIGFSSGLSSTVQSATLAAQELSEQYPDRRVITVDTLCASAGQGLIVYLAVQEKNNGKSLDEVAAFVQENYPNMCHWFTVDDLVYLKRGGRVSAATALVGTMLNIKPVLHVDDEGHLISVDKVRGRKQAIAALAAKYDQLALEPANGVFFISHADCLDDAKKLESLIAEKHGPSCTYIADIGPVIGSHAGPGTLALFFLGKNR